MKETVAFVTKLIILYHLGTLPSGKQTHILTKSARTYRAEERAIIRNPRFADLGQRSTCEKYQWPEGRYALPKSQGHCPSWPVSEFWNHGWRYQDTNDLGKFNSRSKIFHLEAIVTNEGILHHFCVKNHTKGCGEWPPGKYCLYRVGGRCPQSMNDGYIIWDDEDVNNLNDYAGEIPDGVYNRDTQIFFCCRDDDGYQKHALLLPNLLPFFLFPSTQKVCPEVFGMGNQLEYIQFSLPATATPITLVGSFPYLEIDNLAATMKLYFCYFTPNAAVVPSQNLKQPLTESPEKRSNIPVTATKPMKFSHQEPKKLQDEIQKNIALSSEQDWSDHKNMYFLIAGGIATTLMLLTAIVFVIMKCRKSHSNIKEFEETQKPKSQPSTPSGSPPASKSVTRPIHTSVRFEPSSNQDNSKNQRFDSGSTCAKSKSDDIIREEQPVEDGFVEKSSYHSNIPQGLHLLYYQNLSEKSKEKPTAVNEPTFSTRLSKNKKLNVAKPVEKTKPTSHHSRNK